MRLSSLPWVFIDLETTGLSPDKDNIIEFGLARREGADSRLEWSRLVNPGKPLDSFISRFTGIDDAMLAEAPLLEASRDEAVAMISDVVLVAHNAVFDAGFLQKDLKIEIDQAILIDTIELAKILYPGLHSYSLRGLTREFNLGSLPSHRALDDALALEQVFVFLAAKACSLPRILLTRIAESLGDARKGLAGFFTELLLGDKPEWLDQAINELREKTDYRDDLIKTDSDSGAEHGNDIADRIEQSFFDDEQSDTQNDDRNDTDFDTRFDAQIDSDFETQYENDLFAINASDKRGSSREEEKDRLLAREFWDGALMGKLLDDEGALSKLLANYRRREQQIEMLEQVKKAFSQSRYLMIEAPTGVGKSLAYLIPAICWARAFGMRVVIATHTIALQEQLYHKEISLLKGLFPFNFQCVMLKGRGNYLCLNRWRQVMEHGRELIWGERVLLARLAVWYAEGGSGDIDSLRLFGIERDWFAQMASSKDTCQGSQCRYAKDCFYQKARTGAATAHIIIVNHALLLSGARLGDKVLPKFSYLIVDEAHHLEDEGTRQFSEAFSLLEYEKKLQQLHRRRDVFGRSGFLLYLKEYRQAGHGSLENLNPRLEELEKRIKAVMGRVNALQAFLQGSSLREEFRIKPGSPMGDKLKALIDSLDNLMVMGTEVRQSLEGLEVALKGEEGGIFEETWLRQQLTLFEGVKQDTRLLELFLRGIRDSVSSDEPGGAGDAGDPGNAGDAEDAEAARDPINDGASYSAGDWVYWVSRDTRKNDISLCLTPSRISECFQKYLFEDKEAIVFTSATLSVNDGFGYCVEELGIDNDILDTKILTSPFDHARQVLLLSDKDLPDPSRTSEQAYNLALAESLETLLGACGGRTMALFTSHKQLRSMFDALLMPLRSMGLELFADGVNGNRSTLLDELRANDKAVVFGASTYWEGIDLPGLSLTSLLIVRLPFSPPGQPLTEARIERLQAEGKDSFYDFSLPNAVLRFKQGYGRLIRTSRDWGVVVVLDNRIIHKSYGKVFRQSLPCPDCDSASSKELARKISAWRIEKMKGEV